MALKCVAGSVLYTLRNENRETANPPVQFQNYGQDLHFSYCLWVKTHSVAAPNSTVQLAVEGTDGSFLFIHHDNAVWHIHTRNRASEDRTITIAPVVVGRWMAFGIVINHTQFRVYTGTEPATPDPNTPLSLTLPFVEDNFGEFFTFNRLYIQQFPDTSICNFKYWNTVLIAQQMKEQINSWNPADGSGARPMWSSPLRSPGDISNVANPYTSPNWGHGHAFSQIDNASNLVFDPVDPAYMASKTICHAWLYAVVPNTGTPKVLVNPGTSPGPGTLVKGTEFWQFEDRGAIPTNTPFSSATYYGYPYHLNAGQFPTNTYGYWRDELGKLVEILTNRFEDTTGVLVPSAMNFTNIYNWVFGAQFQYPGPVGEPTAHGALNYIYLYIAYGGGSPSGIGVPHIVPPPYVAPPPGEPEPPPPLPVPIKMSGLFVILRDGPAEDNYASDLILKIPNPTIRTAFFGE